MKGDKRLKVYYCVSCGHSVRSKKKVVKCSVCGCKMKVEER